MLTLVIYDITDNKTRKRISDRLLDLGMTRAQYSVFIGTADKNRLDELTLFAESKLAKTDKLYVIPIERNQLSAARFVGAGIDEALVTDELLTKVV